MEWKIGKRGMGWKGGMMIIPLIVMLMIGNVGATTVNVSIAGLGDDLVLGKDYAVFNITVANATSVSKVQIWGGSNASNLSKLKEWTTSAAYYTYNWTNLSDGVKYYYKVAVLDNGTWVNKTGNFTVQTSSIMVYLTGEEAYKTWITGGMLLLGLALQGSKQYRKFGVILLIIGVIVGIYWFNPLNIMGYFGGG
ncbi:MAG: hypothetical protein J7L31_05330 [Thermoplasmata archaeon]|nr:hypothetical protein [Thermoplasmata archaeon]